MFHLLNSRRVFLAGIALVLILEACGAQPTTIAPTAAPLTTTLVVATTAPTPIPATSVPTAPAASPIQPTAAATDAPVSNNDSTGAIKKINLNTATAEQILTIPNTGNRMVREFQEYRPYTSILQFRREIGKYVDDATVAEYEKFVFVPIVPNSADAETLQQIPGVDSTEAGALIAARPYASNDAFLQMLSQFISAQDLAVAQTYLAGS